MRAQQNIKMTRRNILSLKELQKRDLPSLYPRDMLDHPEKTQYIDNNSDQNKIGEAIDNGTFF